MKIVVTGALGHIGSQLIREIPLWFKDPEIVLIDNMSAQRYCSLFRLPEGARFSFLEGDVHTMDLSPSFAGAELVVHLAAITNAAGSFEIREKIEKENYFATERVALACLEVGAKMISLSSTSVYGTQKEVVDEDCSEEDLKPQSPYAETKLREERLLQELSATKNLKTVVCRFGTIFGTSPGMRFHTAVNKFCFQASVGQPVTVWRTAYNQKRPYLHLEDALRSLRFVIDNDIFDGRIYNVLTLNATVANIVDAIRKHVPDLEIKYVDTQIMNQLSYEVSAKRFESLGFTSAGSLEAGIADTMRLLERIGRPCRSPKK